ncbi:hypothetical protein [Bradyrhizobium sp. HKCCYLS20291]|uniref:hypothetical protein n=1 Tax=Bradyrhizobium sp. HKCCYLS20291 TaxID=3420766 RepID=UPI003EBF472F
MEHYEIEDVRNRPKRPLQPLRAELHTQSILAHLRLTNAHETDIISDLHCEIEANFSMQRDSLGALGERGIRALAPRSELHFHLGSLIEILQTNEPVVTFRFSYTFHDAPMVQSATFHLADWNRSAIMQSPVELALVQLGEKLDKMNGQIEGLRKTAEAYTNAVADGSGLRLSQRSIHALKDVPQLFDPREFDAAGYCIIASISLDDAYAIARLRYFPNDQAKELYEQISPEVRSRFEKHFKIDFSEED